MTPTPTALAPTTPASTSLASTTPATTTLATTTLATTDLGVAPAESAARRRYRRFSLLDRLIAPADQALRTLTGVYESARSYPAEGIPETLAAPDDRRRTAALMRVNHSGEVAAQALYQGQAFGARTEATRASLEQAAREETDHLAWCAARIRELGGRTSLLNPLWYAGSFAIGALASAAGDRTSLGFVAETERQVVEHLEGHLHRVPQHDERTRAIIVQMSSDEAQHGREAVRAGAGALPAIARTLMKLTARVMTRTAYRL
jgi:3-demethoxyubiquinol 3-hydroxylase